MWSARGDVELAVVATRKSVHCSWQPVEVN